MKLPLTLLLAGVLFLAGARNVLAQSSPKTNSPAGTNAVPRCVHWHTIKLQPGPKTPRIHFYNKLNPVWWFKNSDEPEPPEWYEPNGRHRRLDWSFRNPMHNFNCYVIGVTDKKFARSGRFPEKNSDPRGGWDFEGSRYKFIWLPFISYDRPKFEFYFGWRNHGSFGIKININSKRKPESKEAKDPAVVGDQKTPPRVAE